MRNSLAAALLLLAGAASAARAALYAPGKAAFRPPRLSVIDEAGAPEVLAASGAPTLLLPIFTRCNGTCPITTQALKAALKGRIGFAVILLSFDPSDTPVELRIFRSAHELPPRWRLLRAADAGEVRGFLDGLGFNVMSAPGGFVHPDQTFVFSPGGVWAGTFYGDEFTEKDLERARRWALGADSPTLADALRRPEAWIAAASGALCVLFLVMLGAPRRAGRAQGLTAK